MDTNEYMKEKRGLERDLRECLRAQGKALAELHEARTRLDRAREAIPEAIRQAGYPSLATQTENDLAELAKLQNDEIVRLQGACRRARSLCNQCGGRGIVANKVIDVLTEVLEGEAE